MVLHGGDAEAAVVELLTNAPELAGAPAATDLVGYQGGPWLRVVRTGGMPIPWRGLDYPAITVEIYADDKGAALDLAWAARAAIRAGRGQRVADLTVCDVLDADGPAWSPDEKTPHAARYSLRVVLVTKPAV